MVLSLSFVHPKGANIAGRFWPHQGHLGLTPLVISGIIRVRAENESNHTASLPSSSLAAPSTSSSSSSTSSASFSSLNGNANGALRASQVIISLRCYEARLGRVGVVKTNVLYDLPISLWSATASPPSSKRGPQAMRGPTATTPDALPIADLPHTDFPFHISIPPSSAGGCSSCHLQSYRVYWRLEATVNGLQAPGYGSRLTKHYDVAITRYNSPTASALPSPSPYSHGLGPSPSSSSSTSHSSPAPLYLAHTIPITNHPHILALTTYKPQRALGPLEEFPVTIALTVRGSSAQSKDRYQQQHRYPTPPPSSSLSSSPTAAFSGGSGSQRDMMPLKVVASIKRIVELVDEDITTISPTSPPSSKKNKSSSSGIPPPPPLPAPFIHESLSPPPRGSSFSFYGKAKRANQTRRPPTTPAPTTASLIITGDKHSRHKSLTPEMERRFASSSTRSGGPSYPTSSSGGLTVPSSYSATSMKRKASPEGTLVASSSTSASSSDAESVLASEDDDDGEYRDAPSEKDQLISVPMDLDGMPTPNSNNMTTPPHAGPAKPGGALSGGGGGPFSLFEKHFPWASSSSPSSSSAIASPTNMDGVTSSAGAAVGAKKGRDKKTLFEESASFPRVPLSPLSPPHYAGSSTNALVTPAYEPLTPPHYTPTTITSATEISSSEKARIAAAAIPSPHTAETYATTLTLKIPAPKSAYHWATGETLRTGLVRVRFVIGYKITLTTPSGGTETWKAPETEIIVGPIGAPERARILTDHEATMKRRQQPQQPSAKRQLAPIRTSLESPFSQLAGRISSSSSHRPQQQQLPNRGGSPIPDPSLLTVRSLEEYDGLAPPRDSTESAVSAASSFVTVSAMSPSAPNGGRRPASNLVATQRNGNSSSGMFSSFLERRSARKTPPPPGPAPPPRGPPTSGVVVGYGRTDTTTSSSNGGGSNKIPRLSRPRTATGIVRVSSKSAAPTAISGDQPIELTRTTTSVSVTSTATPSGSGIGIRRRRMSGSPPPLAHPPPAAAMKHNNGSIDYSNPPPPYSLSTSFPSSGFHLQPAPVSHANNSTTTFGGAKCLKLDVEYDIMRGWEEELDRIAIHSKHQSVSPPTSSSRAATSINDY